MSVECYSLGAAEEVTGSKHIFEIDGRAFMIDCGAFQGKRAVADQKNRNFEIPIDKIETVILTHAHYDHCGLLPLLAKKGYNGNIYATPATRDLTDLVIMDSARIQSRDAEYLRKQALKKGEKFNWQPLYTESDCIKAENQIITLGYNRKMYIAPDVELEFFDAGHILGSAFASITIKGQRGREKAVFDEKKLNLWNKLFFWKSHSVQKNVLTSAEMSEKTLEERRSLNDRRRATLEEQKKYTGEERRSGFDRRQGKDEIRILYTGDLGRTSKPIIRDPSTNVPPPDYIFLESTYGNRRHEGTEIAMDELRKVVRRAIDRKGKVIIPAFAIERTQELIYYLHLLVDQKKIPQIPIYIDSPMAVNATSIFQIHPECYSRDIEQAFLDHHKNPFGFASLSLITSVEESKKLNTKSGPMIIIAADGMCEAGRVVHHLANGISDPKNTVLIVGYMAQNTLGRKIRDGAKEVKIMDEWYQVNAHIETINAFSAHADYQEELEWLKKIDTSRLKRIFLVHGEKEAQDYLKEYLKKHGYKDVEIVKYGKTYSLD
ncbi:MBL fold metallo-hydrolase RNA specificity domain-containing protein [Treponema pectinovorum]|uniref:MBL fold metallo-hydrolase RNA specificity domain-containing protein n=1 Tax=Treponema pectinovorum TaxID=164 RepID=UPI0011CB0074|nr:MBL fold metallo-hydrolase [Treponema pectinovorum]